MCTCVRSFNCWVHVFSLYYSLIYFNETWPVIDVKQIPLCFYIVLFIASVTFNSIYITAHTDCPPSIISPTFHHPIQTAAAALSIADELALVANRQNLRAELWEETLFLNSTVDRPCSLPPAAAWRLTDSRCVVIMCTNDQFRKLYWMKKKKAWNPRKG